MKVRKAYKTELKPNGRQRELLENHAGAARFAYNWGLARKVSSYDLTGKSLSAIDLHRELNALKKTRYPWLYEVSKCAPQEALRDLDRAYANFFRRAELKKRGKFKGKVGFPRFKSRKRGLGSFKLTGSIHVEESRLKLPRLGWIRLKEKGYLPAEGKTVHILSATVSERAGRWFASLQVEEETPEPVTASGPPVGIDLGVKTLATCSNNMEAHAHYRMSCVRSDAIHKATSEIAAKAKPPSMRPAVVAIEDLNVSGMVKNRRLARSVVDASMREFRRQLSYKCAWYGIELVVVPRFETTSKPCSRCGWVREDLKLSDRVFRCGACGHVADRDDNASDNILSLAVSSTERINGCGGDVRPLDSERRTPMKRQSERVA